MAVDSNEDNCLQCGKSNCFCDIFCPVCGELNELHKISCKNNFTPFHIEPNNIPHIKDKGWNLPVNKKPFYHNVTNKRKKR